MTLVTYVIPCFNSELFISECVTSVFSQNGVDVEAVVVDDGSTDHSHQIVERLMRSHPEWKLYLHTHHRRQNRGVSASRRLGVMRARGEYICFLDADDYLIDPCKSLDQVAAFRCDPSLAMVHTSVSAVGAGYDHSRFNIKFGSRASLGIYRLSELGDWLSHNQICNSTAMVRASLLKSLQFDSPQCYQYEDWGLWLLLSQHGSFMCLPFRTVAYRLHAESATSSLLRNKLRHFYSLIELKLVLLARSGLSWFSCRILLSLAEDLHSLIQAYSVDGISSAPLPRTSRPFMMLFEALLYPVICLNRLLARSRPN